MSGSPAYVNGKLAGAVSGVFYDDATFAVLTPADAMLDLLEYVGASPTPARRVPLTDQVRRAIAKADGVSAGD